MSENVTRFYAKTHKALQSHTYAHPHTHPPSHTHTRHERMKWENFTARVENKRVTVQVWDSVFVGVKGATLKRKSPLWGECLPVFTQRFNSLPPCQFLPQTFHLMCLPSAHLTAVKLPFSISSEKSEFLAGFHLRRNKAPLPQDLRNVQQGHFIRKPWRYIKHKRFCNLDLKCADDEMKPRRLKVIFKATVSRSA